MIDWKAIKKAADEDIYMNPDTMSQTPAYSQVDYMRRALSEIYGGDVIGDLADPAYVQRKWRAAMQGQKRGALMAAYNNARQTGNGMSSQMVGSPKPSNGYGISTPYYRQPQAAAQRADYYNPHAGVSPNQSAMDAQRASIDYWRNRNRGMSNAYKAQAGMQAYNRQPETRQVSAQNKYRRNMMAALPSSKLNTAPKTQPGTGVDRGMINAVSKNMGL